VVVGSSVGEIDGKLDGSMEGICVVEGRKLMDGLKDGCSDFDGVDVGSMEGDGDGAMVSVGPKEGC